MPKASIIIVTYNSLFETTAPCLESVFAKTDRPGFEVIVVDNDSSDDTPAYLSHLAEREPRLKCVLNKSNRGYAGGNNDGIKAASSDFLVLLNSDTLVTEGWLERCVGAVEENRSIGLVSTVSNAVGNEQRIFVSGRTTAEILSEGRFWAEMSRGDTFETERLGFFCVAMRRDVIQRVGLLDEAFGLGFFEDDDYCMRVRKAGYKLVCLEDVFVYHRGSTSFRKDSRAINNLMKKNRRLLDAKHSLRSRSGHPRDKHMDLIESYIEKIGREGPSPGLVYKTHNRFSLLEELRPRGPLKRLQFERRERHLRKLFHYALEGGRNANE